MVAHVDVSVFTPRRPMHGGAEDARAIQRLDVVSTSSRCAACCRLRGALFETNAIQTISMVRRSIVHGWPPYKREWHMMWKTLRIE